MSGLAFEWRKTRMPRTGEEFMPISARDEHKPDARDGEAQGGSGLTHICGDCGQAIDLRSLAEVIHHDKPGHQPLSPAELARLRP